MLSSNNKSVVVCGEAPETDSEDEIQQTPNKTPKSVQGELITGEDSESDNDAGHSVSSSMSAMQQEPACKIQNSLLHYKLNETNRQFYQELETFITTSTETADKNLCDVEQRLLKSQLTVQAALTSLKSLNANSATIKNKLQDVLETNFLKNVNSLK